MERKQDGTDLTGHRFKADLYAVLVAKWTGEYLELALAERGNGIKGLHEVHRCCTLQTEGG